NAAMKEAAAAQIAAEIAEVHGNINELQKEIDSAISSGNIAGETFFGSWLWGNSVTTVEEAQKKMEVEWKKFAALKARQRAMNAGDSDAVLGVDKDAAEDLKGRIEAEKNNVDNLISGGASADAIQEAKDKLAQAMEKDAASR